VVIVDFISYTPGAEFDVRLNALDRSFGTTINVDETVEITENGYRLTYDTSNINSVFYEIIVQADEYTGAQYDVRWTTQQGVYEDNYHDGVDYSDGSTFYDLTASQGKWLQNLDGHAIFDKAGAFKFTVPEGVPSDVHIETRWHGASDDVELLVGRTDGAGDLVQSDTDDDDGSEITVIENAAPGEYLVLVVSGDFGVYNGSSYDLRWSLSPVNITAPEVSVDTQTVALGKWTNLSKVLTYSDVENNDGVFYELRAADGTPIWWADGGFVDASTGYQVTDMDTVRFRGTGTYSVNTLEIRAYDGDFWSDWDSFDLISGALQLDVTASPMQPLPAAPPYILNTATGFSTGLTFALNDGAEALTIDLSGADHALFTLGSDGVLRFCLLYTSDAADE